MSCFKTSDADSPLISTTHHQALTLKKALRRLSCASRAASSVSTPEAAEVRTAAELIGKKTRRRKKKNSSKKETRDVRNQNNHVNIEYENNDNDGDDDVWCGDGHEHAMMMYGMYGRGGGGRRHDVDRIQREIIMFQTRMMSGRMNSFDRHRDWRLDVDRMSYEELLELGDRIGHVNTGLREEEISSSLSKMKHSIVNASPLYFSKDLEKKCSICQEEYEMNDDIGKLKCGHSYHTHCIKQWLLQKNACPVCKTAVTNKT